MKLLREIVNTILYFYIYYDKIDRTYLINLSFSTCMYSYIYPVFATRLLYNLHKPCNRGIFITTLYSVLILAPNTLA